MFTFLAGGFAVLVFIRMFWLVSGIRPPRTTFDILTDAALFTTLSYMLFNIGQVV